MQSDLILPTVLAICAVWIGIGLAKGILLRCLSILGLGIDAVLGLPLFRFSPLCRRLSDRLEGWAKTIQKDPASRNVVGFGLLLVGVASVLVWAASPNTYVLEWPVRAAIHKKGLVDLYVTLRKGTPVTVVRETDKIRVIQVPGYPGEKVTLLKENLGPDGVFPSDPRLMVIQYGPYPFMPAKAGEVAVAGPGTLTEQPPIITNKDEAKALSLNATVPYRDLVLTQNGKGMALFPLAKGIEVVGKGDKKTLVRYQGNHFVISNFAFRPYGPDYDPTKRDLQKRAENAVTMTPFGWVPEPLQAEADAQGWIRSPSMGPQYYYRSWAEVERMMFWTQKPLNSNLFANSMEKTKLWQKVLSIPREQAPEALRLLDNNGRPEGVDARTWKPAPGTVLYQKSLRPEFERMGIKVRSARNNIAACTGRALADILEFTWSKTLNRHIRFSEGNIVKTLPSEWAQTELGDALTFKGDQLSELKNAAVGALEPVPNKQIKWEYLNIEDSPSAILSKQTPVSLSTQSFGVKGLMIKAIDEGYPLHVSMMTQFPNKGMHREEIQTAQKFGPFRKTMGSNGSGFHTLLIVGYRIQWVGNRAVLLWETRNNWGPEYANGGYAFLPSYDIDAGLPSIRKAILVP